MSLASRSMLVSLSQRMWWANASDRQLGMQAERANDADNRSLKVVKQLIPPEYTLPIKRIALYGRDQHIRLTLPGIAKGQQLLATKTFDEYAMGQGAIKEAFFIEVQRFVDRYPEIIAAAPARLGKAFRESDFPSPDRIHSYFDYSLKFSPVPEAGNWLLEDIDMEDVSKLANELSNEQTVMFREATKELVDRLMKSLQNLASQAENYKEGITSGGMLREATIESVKDIAHLVPKMNMTGDPMIEAAAKEMIVNFSNLDAKDMRKDATVRNDVASVAQRIMAKLKAAQ
jgi:hypothetical protein